MPTKNEKPDFQYMEDYINNLGINHINSKNVKMNMDNNISSWRWVKLSDVFDIYRTENINYDSLNDCGCIPYVTRTTMNNGVEKFVDNMDFKLNEGNVIIIGGESAEAFYQKDDFLTGNNITILKSDKLNKYNALFLVTVINKEKFKYSYGRAFNTKNVKNTKIKLPFLGDVIDWRYMEEYIKYLPYADKI